MTLTTDGLVIFHEENGHRITYHPGNDLSSASQDVAVLASQIWTPEAIDAYQSVMVSLEPEAEPPAPDWDGLNTAILSNAEFNQAYATVMQIYPLVAAALPAALTQVASGQTAMFETTFLAMCQIAQVSSEQRAIWADIGATYNAPSDFLNIVRGTDGE